MIGIESKKRRLTPRIFWEVLKTAGLEFVNDNVIKFSAALAYYAIFSIPSMLFVLIGLCGLVYGKNAVQGDVFAEIQEFVGPSAALQIQDILKNITLKRNTIPATIIGSVTLFLSSSGMFGEMQSSINLIWGLKTRTSKGIIRLLMNRLLSFSMILVLGFILAMSLLLNTVLTAFVVHLERYFSHGAVANLYIMDHALMFVVTSVLFGFIFRTLPDAKVKWKDVWIGAIITSVLFFAGKLLIGYYLAKFAGINAYGAVGSLIAVLLWVYYSAMILYFGAEFTQVYARQMGRRITPNNYAVWINKQQVEIHPHLAEDGQGSNH